jgi:magnesium transporter
VWVHASSVTDDDLADIVRRYHLDPNVVRDVRDVSELPRIEYGDKATYIFLRTPRLTKRGEVFTSPLLLAINDRRFFTLGHNSSFDPNTVLPENSHSLPVAPIDLALLTFAAVMVEFEDVLRRTSRSIRDVGYRLRSHEVTNKDFIRFATIEDNLNECVTSLDGILALTHHVRENRRGIFSESDIETVDDIILHIQQLLVAVKSQRQSIESIRNAYTTIANNSLNQRMKTLTVLTVLIALPNVFYGMYGMNIGLPFQHEPWAYPAVVLFTILLIIIIYVLARRFKIF